MTSLRRDPRRPTPTDGRAGGAPVVGLGLALGLGLAVVAGCGKVPTPGDLMRDARADRRANLCQAWSNGTPRTILAEAAHGDADQRYLATWLLRDPDGDDPDELVDAMRALHTAADELHRGSPEPDAVVRRAEPALATTDRWFSTNCATTATGPAHTGSTR